MKLYNLDKALQQKERVTGLSLHRRGLDQIPEAVFSLPNLRSLDLSNNRLKRLPAGLLQLHHLEELILSGNHLTEFPEFLSQLPGLKMLDLSNNKISDWSGSSGKFPALEKLLLKRNKLDRLPDTLENYERLKIFDLSQNALNKLPAAVSRLRHLRKFSVSDNQLSGLPLSLFSCHQIGELDLSRNRIKKLPSNISRLHQLYRLNLSENLLSCLPKELADCSILAYFDSSCNQLTSLPSILFSNWPHLRELILSRNSISEFPSLERLLQLRKLVIDHNLLRQLPPGLEKLKHLDTLSVRNNPVNGFDPVLLHLLRLRQLEGIVPASQRKGLLRLLKAFRKHAIPPQERKYLYHLMLDWQFSCPQSILLKACALGMVHLRNQAIRQLVFRQRPISFPENAEVSLLGRTTIKTKELSHALKRAGIGFSSTVSAKTTHLILGKQIPISFTLPEKEFVFLCEEDIFQLLGPTVKGYLQQAGKQQLDRLSRLLCSREDANIEIALQILKGGGLPASLFTNLFIAWKTAQRPSLRRELNTLLKWHSDGPTRKALQLKLGLSGKLKKETIRKNILRYSEGTRLEEVELLVFFLAAQKTNG